MPDIEVRQLPETLLRLCRAIADAGGRAWLVGGCVRDLLLDRPSKDLDLEVFGLEPAQLNRLLQPFGRCQHVGKHFGVTKLITDDLELDIAIPRTETKTARGHRGFSTRPDPELAPEKACLRRDFTINAMMLDPLDGTLLDFYGGRRDLEQRVLRHVSTAFAEDPLRVLRGMQLASRFCLHMAPETAALCRRMVTEADALPKPRLWGEWQKWSHGNSPSMGLELLDTTGWLACYPELQALQGCVQNPRWHPEGDVWRHTCLVVDQAARIATERNLDRASRELLLFAALCHDLGKAVTTQTSDQGIICSPNHSVAGIPLARSLLERMGAPKRLMQSIEPMIREHLVHLHGDPTDRAVRRLAVRLQPVSIRLWEMLVEADASGRHPSPASRPGLPWLEVAKKLDHLREGPKPLVDGKMLLQLGMKPGPAMGAMISKAFEEQLNGTFNDKDSARRWCREQLQSSAQ